MRTPLALLLLGGAAASLHADVFHWSGQCGEDWFAVCDNGLPPPDCMLMNNWGRSNDCDDGNPDEPGPGDDAIVMGGGVRIPAGVAHVGSLFCEGHVILEGGSLQVEGAAEILGPMMIEQPSAILGGDFALRGPLEFPPHAALAISSSTIHIFGPWNWHGGPLTLDGAHLVIEMEGHFEMHGESQLHSSGPSSFTNRGHFNKHGEASIDFNAAFINQGMIDMHGGTLRLMSPGNSLGGMMHLHPPVTMEVTTDAAAEGGLMLMGPGMVRITDSGLLYRGAGDEEAQIHNPTVNNGRVLVEDRTLMMMEFTQESGVTTIDEGTLTSGPGQPMRFVGGVLEGKGVVDAHVFIEGASVAPDGELAFGGSEPRDYFQSDAATLEIDISGAAPGTGFDRLLISGTAMLGGTLRVNLGAYSPAPGEAFRIIECTGRVGEFGTEDLPTGMSVQYGPDFVQIVASSCPADLSGSSDPNDPAYGVPDGGVDSSDFFYYLDQFVAGNVPVADLSGSTDPNDAAYGVPDGALDASDFFYYLDLFVAGCP